MKKLFLKIRVKILRPIWDSVPVSIRIKYHLWFGYKCSCGARTIPRISDDLLPGWILCQCQKCKSALVLQWRKNYE